MGTQPAWQMKAIGLVYGVHLFDDLDGFGETADFVWSVATGDDRACKIGCLNFVICKINSWKVR